LKNLVADADWGDVDSDAAQVAYAELERQVGKLKLLIAGGSRAESVRSAWYSRDGITLARY
jgi:hypothetical protein